MAELTSVLSYLRYTLGVDENGDTDCGIKPANDWEVGYCAGLRSAYRTLRDSDKQNSAAHEARDLQPGTLEGQAGTPAASPASAEPIIIWSEPRIGGDGAGMGIHWPEGKEKPCRPQPIGAESGL